MSVPVATASSSSAPVYFDPNTVHTNYNLTESLVDGGIICNNPSMYAYLIAKEMRGKQKIRLVSLGTGYTAKEE